VSERGKRKTRIRQRGLRGDEPITAEDAGFPAGPLISPKDIDWLVEKAGESQQGLRSQIKTAETPYGTLKYLTRR